MADEFPVKYYSTTIVFTAAELQMPFVEALVKWCEEEERKIDILMGTDIFAGLGKQVEGETE